MNHACFWCLKLKFCILKFQEKVSVLYCSTNLKLLTLSIENPLLWTKNCFLCTILQNCWFPINVNFSLLLAYLRVLQVAGLFHVSLAVRYNEILIICVTINPVSVSLSQPNQSRKMATCLEPGSTPRFQPSKRRFPSPLLPSFCSWGNVERQ